MLNRLRVIGDQRFDLPHFNKMLDSIEDEFQAYNKHFFTRDNRIVKNWKIENAGGLAVRVNVSSESVLFVPEYAGEENLLVRNATEEILSIELADNAVNYVELKILKNNKAPEAVAIWDSIANGQTGEEYSQISDICTKLDAELVTNTIAPSGDSDKILLAVVTTLGGAITNVLDKRIYFWEGEEFDFGSTRTDLGIFTLKDAYDALTTIVKEIKGTDKWYSVQSLSTLDLLERHSYILTGGENISWEVVGIDTLKWLGEIKIIVPNRPFNYSIAPQEVAGLADGELIYVTLPNVGEAPTGDLAVQKTDDQSLLINPENTRAYVLAYRLGNKIYFGPLELETGETNQIGDGITKALLIAGGLTDENDSTPPYASTEIITSGTSWTNAISQLDAALKDAYDLINGNIYNQTVQVPLGGFSTGTQITLPAGRTYEIGKSSLEVFYDGRSVDVIDDFLEVDNGGGIGDKIELVYDRPGETKIKFRIQIGGQAELGGGTGGADLGIENEGSLIEGATTKMNFTGLGIHASQSASGEVTVNVPGLAAGPSSLPPTLQRLNDSGIQIQGGKLIFLTTGDTIEMTTADVPAKGAAVGVAAGIIENGEMGDFYSLGWVIPGILDGLNIQCGEMVYMSETLGGMIGENDPNLPDDITDVVFKLGVATNLVSGEAKDLIMQAEREFN